MNARRPLAPCVAVSALLFGCVLASPDFDDPALGTGTTDTEAETSVSGDPSGASASTTSGSATESAGSDSNSASDGVTSEPTDGTATEGTVTGTTSDVTSDNTSTGTTSTDGTTTDDTTSDGTTTGGTTSDGTTTGGVDPGTYDLNPTVSTCVFLASQSGPYSKPACLNSAAAQVPENDVIIVDTAVFQRNGQGRRAEGYFKFPVPAEFGDASISSATLRIQTPTTPYVPAPEGGQLVLMEPYTEGSLDSQVPNILQNIGPKQGPVPNQPVWMEWSVDPNLLVPGEALHLGLMPTNATGVFYRKNKVLLRVTIQ